jgi:hypothetical protein
MRMFLRPKLRASAFALLLPILTACATTQADPGATTSLVAPSVPCSALEQIIPSRRDTDDTIRQVREQNAAIAAICEGVKN